MTREKSDTIGLAILAGAVVFFVSGITASGTTSALAYFVAGMCCLVFFSERGKKEKIKVRLARDMEESRQEEFRRDRLRDFDLAQMSKYSAELQHMPEAQRIVAVHHAMEAWKALDRPSSDQMVQS